MYPFASFLQDKFPKRKQKVRCCWWSLIIFTHSKGELFKGPTTVCIFTVKYIHHHFIVNCHQHDLISKALVNSASECMAQVSSDSDEKPKEKVRKKEGKKDPTREMERGLYCFRMFSHVNFIRHS